MTTIRLVVTIPTFRRPATLEVCLTAVLAQVDRLAADTGLDIRGRVAVVDNDPERSAEDTVARYDGVSYVPEPVPGIVAARNAALDHARAHDDDLLAFIDDDETPRDGWLPSLVRTHVDHDADAVWGWIEPRFEHAPDPWIEAGGFFTRPTRTTGTVLPTAATGNLLLRMATITRLGLRFDPTMGMGGGEDTLFTRTLVARGGRIVWCQEAVAIDVVPADRLTRAWVKARSVSHGNTGTRVSIRLAGGGGARLRASCGFFGKGLARVVLGGARSLVGHVVRSPRHQARGTRTACRGWGMLMGSLGMSYQEYTRDASEPRWVRERPAPLSTKE